jgi:hypothetical protein
MKKEVLGIWINALRSGQYEQASGALRNKNGYCPLGVLCDLSKLSDWKAEPNSNKFDYLNQLNYLPKEVAMWAGINDDERAKFNSFFIVYNDYEKLTFDDFATKLELLYKKKKKW